MSIVLLESLRAWWPEVILGLGALLVVALGAWSRVGEPAAPRGQEAAALAVAWLTLLAAGAALWQAPVPTATSIFSGLVICDPFSLAIRWLALATGALVLLMVMGSREVHASLRGEYLGLILFSTLGLLIMAEANHLLMVYLGVELVSLCSYMLVGLPATRRAAEASLKYLLYGALASGVMLFGMSLLFGLTGSLAFPDLLRASAGVGGPMLSALLLAIMLVLAGMAFKISMVPFHMWTPDAYEGAPVPVAALLSVGPKAAGVALLLRFIAALEPAWASLAPLLMTLTAATMTFGNVVALVQTNVKRLLAYSTIGQVGYVLIGIVVHTLAGREAVLVYLVAYLFMNLGAFACVVAVVHERGEESLEAFQGLSRRAPWLACAFTLFLLSLAGIPPFLGFFGKFLLFGAALEAGHAWLAVAGVLNSAIALYYYVNLIRLMYLQTPQQEAALRPAPALRIALVICAVGTLFLGLFPDTLFELLRATAQLNLL